MPASSFLEFCVNAAFVVTAGVHLWQQLRRAQELYERTGGEGGGAWNVGGLGGGGGSGSGSGRPRRVVMTTPQGERILVLASDEALREMGFLPEEEAEEEMGAEEAARRVLLRIPGGGARGGREFGPDDYEALSSLDEGLRPARAAPVSQELLDMLPTHEHHSRKNTEAASSSSSAQGGGGGGEDDKTGSSSSSSSSFDFTCSVCLQDFEEGETVRTLPCLHHFHLACVDPWLKQRGRNLAACPVCKTTVFS